MFDIASGLYQIMIFTQNGLMLQPKSGHYPNRMEKGQIKSFLRFLPDQPLAFKVFDESYVFQASPGKGDSVSLYNFRVIS